MEKEAAMTIIKQACASVVADLATHQKIQEAIKAVEDELDKTTAIV
jgi:hypothetical protein